MSVFTKIKNYFLASSDTEESAEIDLNNNTYESPGLPKQTIKVLKLQPYSISRPDSAGYMTVLFGVKNLPLQNCDISVIDLYLNNISCMTFSTLVKDFDSSTSTLTIVLKILSTNVYDNSTAQIYGHFLFVY